MVAGLWILVVEHCSFDLQLLDHSVAPMHPQSFQEFGLIQVSVLTCVEASIPALHAPLPRVTIMVTRTATVQVPVCFLPVPTPLFPRLYEQSIFPTVLVL